MLLLMWQVRFSARVNNNLTSLEFASVPVGSRRRHSKRCLPGLALASSTKLTVMLPTYLLFALVLAQDSSSSDLATDSSTPMEGMSGDMGDMPGMNHEGMSHSTANTSSATAAVNANGEIQDIVGLLALLPFMLF
jgi:hypothetical protein